MCRLLVCKASQLDIVCLQVKDMTPPHTRRVPHEVYPSINVHFLVIGGLSAAVFSVVVVGVALCVLFLPVAPVSTLLPYLGLLGIAGLFMGIALPYSLAKGEIMRRKAQDLAKKHLGPGGTTELNIIETTLEPTIVGAEIVMNDWGLVYLESAKRPIELSWQDIERVEEPLPTHLLVHSKKGRSFKIVPTRYYLIAAAMYEKLPGRTSFDVNPLTGKSNLVEKLKNEPRKWGKYAIDANGIHWGGKNADWPQIQSVREVVTERDGTSYSSLEIATHAGVINIAATETNDDAYAILKAVLEDALPGKCEFQFKAPSAFGRAWQEFDRMSDTTTAGMKVARKTHKFVHLEPYFAHMQTLQEMFSFEGEAVDRFRRDYADVLQYKGHTDEANTLLKQLS